MCDNNHDNFLGYFHVEYKTSKRRYLKTFIYRSFLWRSAVITGAKYVKFGVWLYHWYSFQFFFELPVNT